MGIAARSMGGDCNLLRKEELGGPCDQVYKECCLGPNASNSNSMYYEFFYECII